MLTFLLLKSISCILAVKKMVVKIFCRRNRKGINSNEYCRQKIFKVPCDSQQIDLWIVPESAKLKNIYVTEGLTETNFKIFL